MPVDTTHPDYDAMAEKWQRCRDVIAGEDAVKAAGQTYLPKPPKMDAKSYQSYLDFALFFNATRRTRDGYVGMVFRKEPEVSVSGAIEPYLDDITLGSVPFNQFCRDQLKENLSVGRSGILVDVQDDSVASGRRPYLVPHKAEDIVNWRTQNIGGDQVLTMVVLHETITETDADDEFDVDVVERYRVLTLEFADENGNPLATPRYRMRLYAQITDDSGPGKTDTVIVLEKDIYPSYSNGSPLEFIPFVFIAPSGVGVEVEDPPLLDLVSVNLSHYKTSADLEYATYMIAFPMFWTAGANVGADDIQEVGAHVIWNLPEGATAQVLGGDAANFSQLENRLAQKQRLMAVLGARLLEEQKKDSEAAETVRLRQTGEQATIQSIASATGSGCQIALRWLALWAGANPDDVSVKLNSEFVDPRMDPQMLSNLITAVQSGKMSFETFYANLMRGGLTRDGVDAETEQQDIAAETPEETI